MSNLEAEKGVRTNPLQVIKPDKEVPYTEWQILEHEYCDMRDRPNMSSFKVMNSKRLEYQTEEFF